MHRYFFDVVGAGGTEFDYRGRDFDNLDQAKAFAELVALDITMSSNDQGSGWRQVIMRSVEGKLLLTIPIRPELRLAAA